MSAARKKLAKLVFPTYSRTIDLMNHNALVGDWIAKNRDIMHLHDKSRLYEYINKHVLHECPIDYLEFGVYKGNSIRNWATLNRNAKSRFFGFNSFEGLPEHWNRQHTKGTFDTGGQIPVIDDARVQFVKGWFQDKLPEFLKTFTPHHRLVIHNDSDLYSSTLYILARLDEIAISGTVLMFDEFSSPLHEFRAFNDYIGSFRRSVKLIAICGPYADQAAFVFS